MLHSKSKFNISSPDRNTAFAPDQFILWTDRNMYRTSYNDMSVKVSTFFEFIAILTLI
jgi:hypothetical protein